MTAGPSALRDLGLRRLLVAIDGSPSSDLALAAAITVAQRDNASLTVMTVEPVISVSPPAWGSMSIPPAELQAGAHEEAEKILAGARSSLPDDLPATSILRLGKAGPQIIAEASTGKYDAIMIGARGVGKVGAIQGSVSQYVLHHAEIAVFVSHAPPVSPTGDRQ